MSRTGLTAKISNSLIEAETQEAKQQILEKYQNETLIKRIIGYAYNPLIEFGMNDFVPRASGKQHGMGISKFLHIIEDIVKNKLDHAEAVFALNLALNHINEDEASILIGMVKKDIGWGLEVDTINAVWPDYIIDYPIQTPTEFNDDLFIKFNEPFVTQVLQKGLRINIVINGNKATFRDRTGKILSGFESHAEQFITLAQSGATVFDGVAVLVDENKNITSTDDEEILAAPKDSVRYILWDAIRYDGFVEGKDNRIGYNWRFNGLEHMMMLAIEKNPDPIYAAVQHKVTRDLKEVEQFMSDNKCDVVVKELSGTWRSGPSEHELLLRQ